MKILLSAYSCLPTQGSEPGIGWNWAQSIAANGHEVFVLTRAVGRPQIECHLATHSSHPVRFVFHDLGHIGQALYKVPLGDYLYYMLWQASAASLACQLHAAEPFEKVQHITWGSLRIPSFMGRLGIPFTFGPVGGGEDTPPKLRKGLGWRGRFWDALRRISSAIMTPLMESTYASASEIVATTPETLDTIPARHRHKARCCQAVGIDSGFARERRHSQRRETSRLELLFVGRVLPWKGLHLVLRALARLNAASSRIHLTVVGDGSDVARLQRMAMSLRLGETVTWTGWQPRETLAAIYLRCDLFTFPSLHDSGGMAVLEAMSFGLPVICLDLGGPAMAVDERSGRVIATRDLDEDRVVASIADFLGEMMVDRAMLEKLSDGARARAASLTWQANVDAVHGESFVTQAG